MKRHIILLSTLIISALNGFAQNSRTLMDSGWEFTKDCQPKSRRKQEGRIYIHNQQSAPLVARNALSLHRRSVAQRQESGVGAFWRSQFQFRR